MKKIYSFVLMAAALLIGANSWADTYTVESASEFETAWKKFTTEDVVIKLGNSEISLNNTMWLGTASMTADAPHSIEIDLDGQELTVGSQANGFVLTHGTLKITGSGTISASCSSNVFYVTGSTLKNCNPENENIDYFSHLYIGKDVVINHSAYNTVICVDDIWKGNSIAQAAKDAYVPEKPALYITNVYAPTATKDEYGVAHGVRVDFYGKIYGRRYGIKTNGNLGSPIGKTGGPAFQDDLLPTGYTFANTDVDYAPFVYVHDGAYIQVEGNNTQTKKPLALYAAGYARWKIEGEAKGGVGLMVKSGEVDIHNAQISSNAVGENTYVSAAESSASSNAVGSAIVIQSTNNYAGNIDVNISGEETVITSTVGYAIDEKVTGGTNTDVELLNIEAGTFNGGEQGAIKIDEVTTNAANPENPSSPATITVTQATITGSVTFGDDQGLKFDDFTDKSVIVPGQGDQEQIVVPLKIKTTFDGYASYSAPIDLVLPTGLNAYTGELESDVLELKQVYYVKANKGIILKGADETNYTLIQPSSMNPLPDPATSADNYQNNVLKASKDWNPDGNHDAIYCLRNVTGETMLYQYLGTAMPANKAYLDLSGSSSAPQRIRMVIAQEEQTEAVERVEAASVKAVKFVENGEILIRRGENVYNLQGQIVK